MQLRSVPESSRKRSVRAARWRAVQSRSTGWLGLTFLAALCSLSCSPTRMIIPNEHSQRVGPHVMRTDKDACFEEGGAERRRLLAELVSGDPEVAERKRNDDRARAVGEALAGTNARTATGGKTPGERGADAVGGAVAEFVFSSWDPDTHDEDQLANYLGIDGGTDIFSATQRLAYVCLRRKGYRVDDHAEDGSGTAYLERDPARVVLREEDGTEVVFYQYLPPSRR